MVRYIIDSNGNKIAKIYAGYDILFAPVIWSYKQTKKFLQNKLKKRKLLRRQECIELLQMLEGHPCYNDLHDALVGNLNHYQISAIIRRYNSNNHSNTYISQIVYYLIENETANESKNN